jgi:type III secretion protein U
MASDNDSGDKTEKPTPKRLKDARKKGDVPKSRDVSSTAGLVLWLLLAAMATGFAMSRIAALYDQLFATIGQGWTEDGFVLAVRSVGWQAAELLLMLSALLLIPAAAVGLLAEFLQAGPVLTFEKITPKLDKMNPVEGVKRMFSMDNLIEVLKGVAKAAILLFIGFLAAKAALPQIVALARAPSVSAGAVLPLISSLTVKVLSWSVAALALVSILDLAYQRHSFEKKMRMSIRDIKKEMKDSEGDPHVKHQRKQVHHEWSQRNNAQAARNATVLLVNPTHVAIAIEYDRETTPVPVISAKGEDEVARAMREAAAEAGVPIVRNIPLARDLLARGEVGEIVPADLFDIIAEVILWAREVRTQMEAERNGDVPPARRRIAPGEDLTRY